MNKGNSPENYIFVPGTKAYSIFLGKRDEKSKCKACNGKGEIVLEDGEKYECPSCYGKGFHWVKRLQSYTVTGPSHIHGSPYTPTARYTYTPQSANHRTAHEPPKNSTYSFCLSYQEVFA